MAAALEEVEVEAVVVPLMMKRTTRTTTTQLAVVEDVGSIGFL